MSILEDVFREEYQRMVNTKRAIENELKVLPKGYISKKNIRGKEQYYLQKRVGSKIVSSYISKKNLSNVQSIIARRKKLELSLKEIESNIKMVKKVIGDE